MRRAGWLLAALLAATAGSAAQAQTAPADVLVSGPAGQITRADLEIMVTDLVPAADRERFWLSRDAVARVARSLYTQRALAAEALKAGLENSPEGAAYLRMIRERALTELRLINRQVLQAAEIARLSHDLPLPQLHLRQLFTATIGMAELTSLAEELEQSAGALAS